MPAFHDKTSIQYGRWLVLHQGPHEGKFVTWVCRCECGTVRTVRGSRLADGTSRSCGCLHKEIQRMRLLGNNINKTHGKTHTKEFRVWNAMINRCCNKNNAFYARYGGRGISVCDRWRSSFENFLADMGEPPKGLTLDRTDNDGNYEPENCRWASRKGQANNRSSNNLITAFGQTKTITQWAEELGTKDPTIRARLKRGWSEEDAVSKSVRHVSCR